jgi:hypothetical protein
LAAYLSPLGNEPQTDANGDPIVGGQIFTYLAGTTTPAATFTDNTGGTPQTNPIILNSLGISASPIWLTGGTAYKFVFLDANNVQYRPTVDNITGVNDPAFTSTIDQWVLFSGTPTYINATSFSLVGDQTNTFQVLRRLRTTNTGGQIFSTITNSVFAAGITTVTVTNDSGTLDSGLSLVYYGILSVTNPSIPETTIGKGIRTAATAVAARSFLPIPAATVQASTSGTSIDFTAIPSWVSRITVLLSEVSTNGADNYLIQIGDSLGVANTGYLGSGAEIINAGATAAVNSTAGFLITAGAAGAVVNGALTLSRLNAANNTWVASGNTGRSDSARVGITAGRKILTNTLDRVRVTTTGGANTFDSGAINILYE